MQLLGRVSDLADLLPPDELRDEVCFSHVLCPETYFFSFLFSATCSSQTRLEKCRSTTC